MRSDLPTGTVTLVFTDVEGSTSSCTSSAPRHTRTLPSTAGCCAKRSLDTAASRSTRRAMRSSSRSRMRAERSPRPRRPRSPPGGPIHVRVGIHTGAPHLTGRGLHRRGRPPRREDRRRRPRRPGPALRGDAPFGRARRRGLLDLGEHRLKDFDEPVRIVQLGAERFPPLKTISNTNLPRPAARSSAVDGRSPMSSRCSGTARGSSRSPARAAPARPGCRSRRPPSSSATTRRVRFGSSSRRSVILPSSVPRSARPSARPTASPTTSASARCSSSSTTSSR